MSLKAFHLVFIIVADITSFGFFLWATRRFSTGGDLMILICSIIALLTGFALLGYMAWFILKMRNIAAE